MSSERYTRIHEDDWIGEPIRSITSITTNRHDEVYDCKPGICLVINNTTFEEALGFRNMPEQEKDEDLLKVTFTSLDFDVVVRRNLTAIEMSETIKEYSRREHKGVFILYILSHGGEDDIVFGSDGKGVRVSAIQEFFAPSCCQSLVGIPKIFFINVCRGSNKEAEHEISESCEWASSTSNLSQTGRSEDFATIYVSSRGMVAHLNEKGSEFTQNLQKIILKADERDDFEEVISTAQESCKLQCVEQNLSLTKRYFIKRDTKLSRIQKNCREFKKAIEEWLVVRKTTIEIIEGIIEKLIEHRKNVNVARIAGGSAAIGGGIMAIAGFALAPVTFGAGLALGIAGVGIGAVGGATAAGAGIADAFIQKNNVADAKEHYERDQRKLEKAINLAEDTQNWINTSEKKCGNIDAKVFAQFFAAGIQIGYRGGAVGLKIAEIAVGSTFEIGAIALRVGGAALRGVAIAGIAVNVLIIPIDIVEVVRASINMKQGNENEAVKQLREFLEKLQAEQCTVEEKI